MSTSRPPSDPTLTGPVAEGPDADGSAGAPPAEPPTRRELLAGLVALTAGVAASACSPPGEAPAPAAGATPAAGAAPATVAAAARSTPGKRPNVLLIVADDLRFDALGIGGHPFLKTPAIDRIGREGVHFDHAAVAVSLCRPSRATLFSMLRPWANGVIHNTSGELDPSVPLFPALLKAAGYTTAHVGKWHIDRVGQPVAGFDKWVSWGREPEYTSWDANVDGQAVHAEGYVTDWITDQAVAWLEQTAGKAPFFLSLCHRAPHSPWTPAGKYAQSFADQALPQPSNWLDDLSGKPAYVWTANEPEFSGAMGGPRGGAGGGGMGGPGGGGFGGQRPSPGPGGGPGPMGPHGQGGGMGPGGPRPGGGPKGPGAGQGGQGGQGGGFAGKGGGGGAQAVLPADQRVWDPRNANFLDYLRTVQSVDDSTGRLLDTLQKLGVLDDTLIIFTSDNGFTMGAHGILEGKNLAYEEAIRIPLLVRHPGLVKAGQRRADLVSLIDVGPTVLDACGVAPPAKVHGRSFKTLLAGGADPTFGELYYEQMDNPDGRGSPAIKAVRNDRWKYILSPSTGNFEELYDLAADPGELKNLAADPAHAVTKKQLAERLAAMRAALA